MAFRVSTTVQNSTCTASVQSPDAGTTNSTGRVLFYTGTQPATPQATATGTLLATLNLNNPSFGSPSSGAASLATSPAVSAAASAAGTPGWCRVVDRNGNAVWDLSVSGTGQGGDVTFDSVAWVQGGVVTLTSLTVTYPM